MTNGAGADGIVISGLDSSVLNDIGGTISVDAGSGAACINASPGPASLVTDDGTLNCSGGDAIRGGDGSDDVRLGAASVTSGAIDLGRATIAWRRRSVRS